MKRNNFFPAFSSPQLMVTNTNAWLIQRTGLPNMKAVIAAYCICKYITREDVLAAGGTALWLAVTRMKVADSEEEKGEE